MHEHCTRTLADSLIGWEIRSQSAQRFLLRLICGSSHLWMGICRPRADLKTGLSHLLLLLEVSLNTQHNTEQYRWRDCAESEPNMSLTYDTSTCVCLMAGEWLRWVHEVMWICDKAMRMQKEEVRRRGVVWRIASQLAYCCSFYLQYSTLEKKCAQISAMCECMRCTVQCSRF